MTNDARELSSIGFFVPCPFDRRWVGDKNHILLRVNDDHARDCVAAIKRRQHPEWSLAGGRIVRAAA